MERPTCYDSSVPLGDVDQNSPQEGSCASLSDPSLKYTYWKREIPDAHLLPSSQPQRIESATATATPSVSAGMSVWNTLGTWEERDVSSRVELRLKTLLRSETSRLTVAFDPAISNSLTFSNIRVNHCEATICYIRGKPKFGYDITVEADWELPSTRGFIKINEITDHSDPTIVLGQRAVDPLDDECTEDASERNGSLLFKELNSLHCRSLLETNVKALMKTIAQEFTNATGK